MKNLIRVIIDKYDEIMMNSSQIYRVRTLYSALGYYHEIMLFHEIIEDRTRKYLIKKGFTIIDHKVCFSIYKKEIN
jgi:hypothetical protein